MKFVISSGELKSAVIEASKAIAPKNLLPIMDCVRIDASDDCTVTVSACSQEIAVSVVRKAVSIAEAGTICLTCKTLLSGLKELPEQLLTITDEKTAATFEHTKGRFCIPTSDANDWPAPSKVDDNSSSSLSVDAAIFADALSRVSQVVAADDLRPIISGVHIEVADDKTYLVGTDRNSLAVIAIKPNAASDGLAVTLPQKAIQAITTTKIADDEAIEIITDGKMLQATFGECGKTINCRLIEGKFPNWKAVIPKDLSGSAEILPQELIEAASRAKVFSNSSQLVKLKIGYNSISITSQDIDYNKSAEEVIPCTAAEECTIGFAADRLATALAISSTTVDMRAKIQYSSPSRPILIKPVTQPENMAICAMLMPMLIN